MMNPDQHSPTFLMKAIKAIFLLLETSPPGSPEFELAKTRYSEICGLLTKLYPDEIKQAKNHQEGIGVIKKAEEGGIVPERIVFLTNGYAAIFIPDWDGWERVHTFEGADYTSTWYVAAFKNIWSYIFHITWANGEKLKINLSVFEHYEALKKIQISPAIVIAKNPLAKGIIVGDYPREILDNLDIWKMMHETEIRLRELQ